MLRAHLVGVLDGLLGPGGEVAVGTDVTDTAVGLVPHAQRDLPGIAADGTCPGGEGLVGDTRVDVDAAVVTRAPVELAVVIRLRVLAQVGGIVVRRARVEHGAQSDALDLGSEDAGADQPGVLVGGELEVPLAEADAKDVREALVESAGFAIVVEARGQLAEGVRHLVSDDVDQDEQRKDDTVAVAVGHGQVGHEGVVVVLAEVHGADQVVTGVVQRVETETLLEEFAEHPLEFVGVVDDLVRNRRFAFEASLGAGTTLGVLGVVNEDVTLARAQLLLLLLESELVGGVGDLLGGDDGLEERGQLRMALGDIVQEERGHDTVKDSLGHDCFSRKTESFQ